MNSKIKFLWVVWILILSCSPFYRKPVLDIEHVTPREILTRIGRNRDALEGLKGRIRLTLELPGAAYSAFSDVVLKSPDSLLLKVEAAFGIDVGVFFVDHEQFTIYSPFENKVYIGEIDALDLRQFFQVDLSIDDLMEVFTGISSISAGDSTLLSVDDGQYLLTSLENDGLRKYWVDPQRHVVSKCQLYDRENNLILEKEFSRFRKEKGATLPTLIRIKRPRDRERFTIFYLKRKINGKIKKDDFRFKIPENTERIEL